MRSSAWPLLASLFVSACTGAVGESLPPQGDPDEDDAPGPATGAGGGPASEPTTIDGCTVLPARIVKLTPRQLQNTVESLLGARAVDLVTPLEAVLGGLVVPDAEQLLLDENHVSVLFDGATQVADKARAEPKLIHPCLADPGSGSACVSDAIKSFGARAFRRPLSAEEHARFLAMWQEQAERFDDQTALWQFVRAVVLSPAFQFRFEVPSEGRAMNDHTVAELLAYVLTDAPPQGDFLEAAATGQLRTNDQIAAQVDALLANPKNLGVVVHAVESWLGVEDVEGVFKSKTAFPTFSPTLPVDMAKELSAFIEHVVVDGEGTFGALFTSTKAFPSRQLAALYGVEQPKNYQELSLPADQRAGVLTRAGLMALYATEDENDIIGRGRFVREEILCEELPPPPPNVPDFPAPAANTTLRERLEQHVTNPACAGCHKLIDDIGFGFEVYDATGAHRTEEDGRPVRATGEVVGGGDAEGKFNGPIELSHRLARSQTAQACFLRRLYGLAYASAPRQRDECELTRVNDVFTQEGGEIKSALRALLSSERFRTRAID